MSTAPSHPHPAQPLTDREMDELQALLEQDLPNYVMVIHTPAYKHAMQPKLTRKVPTIGAED